MGGGRGGGGGPSTGVEIIIIIKYNNVEGNFLVKCNRSMGGVVHEYPPICVGSQAPHTLRGVSNQKQ